MIGKLIFDRQVVLIRQHECPACLYPPDPSAIAGIATVRQLQNHAAQLTRR
jgi:hypothetical protein